MYHAKIIYFLQFSKGDPRRDKAGSVVIKTKHFPRWQRFKLLKSWIDSELKMITTISTWPSLVHHYCAAPWDLNVIGRPTRWATELPGNHAARLNRWTAVSWIAITWLVGSTAPTSSATWRFTSRLVSKPTFHFAFSAFVVSMLATLDSIYLLD